MRNTRNAFTIIVLLIALLLPCFWPARSAQAAPTLGFVAARGRVLDAQGNPIWAEYDTDGSVIKDIEYSNPEALKTARVISAGSYRAYAAAFNAIEQEYGAVSEVLTRAEYDARVFTKPDQSPAIKPLLKKDTACVVVRRENLIDTDNISLILLESPLYLKSDPAIPDNAKAVLLGSDGQVLAASENNIGYRVAYYTLQGSTASFDGASRVAYGMGYRSNTPDYQWGQDSMFGFNEYEDQLRGPMMGVQVNGWFDTTYTDQNGAFEVQGAPFTYTAQAKLRYSVWDPQGGITGVYLLNHSALATWQGRCKFEVDVAIVTGAGLFYNSVNRPGAGPKGYLAQAQATTYAFTPPLVLPVLPEPGAPRLPDQPPDFNDQGLLQTISKQDIDNTDIYIYRLSNDMLITSREGLAGHEWIPKYFTSQYAGAITFHMMIRAGGSFGDSLDIGLAGGGKVWNYDTFQELTNVHESLRPVNADHLRTGEQLKVILINRATGYIGTGIGTVGQKYFAGATGAEVQADSVDVYMGQIQMMPPNLKIKAERKFTIKAGLTKDKTYENMIGFEGSGLTGDKVIAITTQWLDHDGTPLPGDLPGFTGRLAKVVATNQLAPDGGTLYNAPDSGHLANFEIRPGKHLQLVRLPRKDVSNAHYYLHVSGEQPEGNPDFSEIGAAPSGPLQYRPKHYVPLQVPLFDEAATNARKEAYRQAVAGSATGLKPPEPAYQWVYRPEMQFSVFDLDLKTMELEREDDNGTPITQIIPIGSDTDQLARMLEDDVLLAQLFYNLDAGAYNPLAPLGPDRQLVFALGDQEVLAYMGCDQHIYFANPGDVNLLESEDYLALRLYQNGDDGNILWEYAFGDTFSVAYKLPIDIVEVESEKDQNNNDIYRILGGVRLRYKFENGTGNYAWSFSESGRVCQDFDTTSSACTVVTANSVVLTGQNETTVYWEPLEWKTNLNATGMVRLTKPGKEAEKKTFDIVSRELSPNQANPMKGTDVEMLEQMLWMLGRSPQYGYRGKDASRINLSRDVSRNAGTNKLNEYTTGVYTNPDISFLAREDKQIGTMEQMVWRFRYENELDTANRIVNDEFVEYLKKQWDQYVAAIRTRRTSPMDSTYAQNATDSFDYWCAQAALEWDWENTYTQAKHQSIMQQIGAPNITRADLIRGWVDQESSKHHWGWGGTPRTPYRVVIGSGDNRASIGFNQIQTRYIYGKGSKKACSSCTEQNIYDPVINIRSLVLFTTRPGCNPSMAMAFNGDYNGSYDNTSYPKILRTDHDSGNLPAGTNYFSSDYERLSKAIGGYNQGASRFQSDRRTWPQFLKEINPNCSANSSSNNIMCGAIRYSIEVKDKAGIPRQKYLWSDIDANKVFEFWHGESDWYSGVTWAQRRQEALSKLNTP